MDQYDDVFIGVNLNVIEFNALRINILEAQHHVHCLSEAAMDIMISFVTNPVGYSS